MESASSCGPQANSQPEPPIAQAPKPTEMISRSEFPSLRVSIRILSCESRGTKVRRSEGDYFIFFRLDEDMAKKLEKNRGRKKAAACSVGDQRGIEGNGFAVGIVMVIC